VGPVGGGCRFRVFKSMCNKYSMILVLVLEREVYIINLATEAENFQMQMLIFVYTQAGLPDFITEAIHKSLKLLYSIIHI
jgi:hypothetical protein